MSFSCHNINYLFLLVITQCITTTPLNGSAIWFDFFDHVFQRYLENSGGVLGIAASLTESTKVPLSC